LAAAASVEARVREVTGSFRLVLVVPTFGEVRVRVDVPKE
jgi:hypothetical protein